MFWISGYSKAQEPRGATTWRIKYSKARNFKTSELRKIGNSEIQKIRICKNAWIYKCRVSKISKVNDSMVQTFEDWKNKRLRSKRSSIWKLQCQVWQFQPQKRMFGKPKRWKPRNANVQSNTSTKQTEIQRLRFKRYKIPQT